MSWGFRWRPYISVAKKLANSKSFALQLAKKEKRTLAPVVLTGRNMAASFWGKAWCENIEQYSDYDNRLPRGKTYVRNGSVIDLQITKGQIKAIVAGSEAYRVTIDITTLPAPVWARIIEDCSRSVDSLIDLLQGKFDQGVMERLTRTEGGLFPQPKHIKMACTCPDWATMCKHVAATLYGVGARLDSDPELLFVLRNVDHLDLISQAVAADNLRQTFRGEGDPLLGDANLGEIFGIDIEVDGHAKARKVQTPSAKRRPKSIAKSPVTTRAKNKKKNTKSLKKIRAAKV